MEYVYAALLLHKSGKEINEDNIKKVLEAAGVDVEEGKVKALVSALKDVDIEKEIKEAAVAPVAAPSESPSEEKKEEEEEKKSEEQAAQGLGALFG